MADPDPNELLKRLRELEQENARLKNSATPNELVITEGEYNGHPTLTFQKGKRSFTLGLRKLETVKEGWPQVEAFLNKHRKRTAENPSREVADSDDQI